MTSQYGGRKVSVMAKMQSKENNSETTLPRVLVIDDQCGLQLKELYPPARYELCSEWGLRDVTECEVKPVREEDRGGIDRFVAEAVFCRGQEPIVSEEGLEITNDEDGTIEFIRSGWEQSPRWALVLLDLEFCTGKVESLKGDLAGSPKGKPEDSDPESYFGLTLAKRINEEFPDLPLVIMSSNPRDPISLQIDENACRFLSKDKELDDFKSCLDYHGLVPDEKIIGHSLPLLKVLREARSMAADPNRHILILGETGVGKELMAKYLHRITPDRAEEILLPVDGGRLIGPLAESTLFGIEKGKASTVVKSKGVIQEANGGDLFLDEIGHLPSGTCELLYRVLVDGKTNTIGGKSVKLNLRVISATDMDIENDPAFTDAFLNRIRGPKALTVPTLNERREDIPELVEYFVREAEKAARRSGAEVKELKIPEATLKKLRGFNWAEKNIRVLQQMIRAAVLANANQDREYLVVKDIEFPPTNDSPESSSNAIDDALDSIDFESMSRAELKGLFPAIKEDEIRRRARYLNAVIKKLTTDGHKLEYKATYLHMIGLKTDENPEVIKEYHQTTPGLESYNDHTPKTALCKIVNEIKEVDKQLFKHLPELQRLGEKLHAGDKSGNDKESTDPAYR